MAMSTVPGGHAGASYAFSTQPRAVAATRKKYREPGDTDIGIYRDLKETCITWDKRVHRGNTYGLYTQNAIKEALQDATQAVSPKPAKRRRPKEASLFAMPVPEKERVPVDLSAHLVAREQVVEVSAVEAQTDEFLPEPPPPQYQPQKIGVDVHTQVEEGELFNFDREVEPILNVLVCKTLEYSVLEVEEEHEMAAIATFQVEWYQRQAKMLKDWQAEVDEERARWVAKEVVVKQKMEEKRREAQVLLKMQAMSLARDQLARVVPNTVSQLKEVAFPDAKGMAINRLFLPQLFQQVQQQVQTVVRARRAVDDLIAGCVSAGAAARSSAMAAQRVRHQEADRRRHEERQLRQGKIRILVHGASGEQVQVGPVQLSTKDSMEEVHMRVYEWLQEHEPDLAAAWPHGVQLCIDGKFVQESLELFEARAGQISMVPRPAPPPEAEEGEEGNDDAEEDGAE